MHQSALNNCDIFFEVYSKAFDVSSNVKVIEIGSQNVNGSLRQVCPEEFEYIGLDFQDANGVDIILDDPYSLPFEDESVDIVLSSSCFEHSEMFWLVFLEVLRVLKPGGLFYLNAPSAGDFHRFPVDCWRFYPDSGKALVTWAKRNGINAAMLESYTQRGEKWQDFVAVFLKDKSLADRFPTRILGTKTDYENGQLLDEEGLFNESWTSQNEKKLQAIGQIINEQIVLL
jgi:SAM-dependent methyltransferase